MSEDAMKDEAIIAEEVELVNAGGKTANMAMTELASASEQIGDSVRKAGIAYGMPYNNTYNFDLYPAKARWQEGDLTATRTTMWSGPGCHSGC